MVQHPTRYPAKKQLRDKKILEAIEKYGYSLKEIGGYLNLHYSIISRLVNKMEKEM